MILPDLLGAGLYLVLCGTAAGLKSKQAGAYYANPTNRFWAALHEAGLTPVRLRPEQYPEVLRFGIGLTGLCKTEFGNDDELSPSAFDVAGFAAKMRHFRPAAIAFESKRAGRAFYGAPVAYGRQPRGLDGIPVFVLPSCSGQAVRYWDIGPWREAGAFVNARRAMAEAAYAPSSIASMSSSLNPK